MGEQTEGAGRPLPGRFGLPILGETLSFARDPFGFFDERARRYGPVFKTSLLGARVVCFVGPDAFSAFMDPDRFEREGASPSGLRELLGEGAVPFLDGRAHLVRKRLLLSALDRASVARYVPAMERIVGARLRAWAARGEVRLADEVAELAFAATDHLFAGGDPERANPEVRAAFDAFNQGAFAPPIRLPFTAFGRALRARRTLMRYFEEAVARRREEPGDDVLSGLIAARDADDHRLDDAQIAGETLHFFFAAYGGMWAFLTDTAHALVTQSGPAARVRDEVRAQAADGPLTDETLARLAHVERFCLEVKRFYPVIPFTLFARARRDSTVNGFAIPAGMRAVGCTYATSRDKATFADPERFDPDRFGPERAEHLKHPFGFVVQGGGSLEGHRCAGEHFSLVLMKVFAALLARDYAWEAPPQDLSIDRAKLPPVPRDGLRLVLRPASA